MQKNKIQIGSYLLEYDAHETKKQYDLLPKADKSEMGIAFFQHILKKAKKESIDFLNSLGIDMEKLSLVRPVAEPDEEGVVLYLCCAPLYGRLLAGGDTFPRQSEEIEGISVIFVKEKEAFSSGLPILSKEQVEMRFVIPLPFDETFFTK